jgi:HSP20 family protein
MTMARWDPFAGIDRMLDLVYGRGGVQGRSMPIDIFRNGDSYVVEMELPGVDASSIDVNVEGNTLTVTAESRSSHEEADEQVLCERSHARFYRQLRLGDNLDTESVDAKFDNGMLTLTIPVRERAGGRKVEVSTSAGSGTGANASPEGEQSSQEGQQWG